MFETPWERRDMVGSGRNGKQREDVTSMRRNNGRLVEAQIATTPRLLEDRPFTATELFGIPVYQPKWLRK